MKKKLKEFTLGEIHKICRQHDDSGCSSCPFYKKICYELDMYLSLKTLNEVIEYEEVQKVS